MLEIKARSILPRIMTLSSNVQGVAAPQAKPARPTLRADQVGSLLRPQRLKDARDQHEAGRLSRSDLRAIEDDCIGQVVRRQEDAGLHAISDGDFRRSAFHVDFLTKIDGIVWRRRPFSNVFHGLEKDNSPLVFEVSDKIKHTRNITLDDFRFLRAATSRTAKVTLPAPSFVHARGGRDAIDRAAYPDLEEFYEDSQPRIGPRSHRSRTPDAAIFSSTRCILPSSAIRSW